LSRRHACLSIALVCTAALTVGGCKNSAEVFQDQNDGGWFSKSFISKPGWALADNNTVNLGPRGPVGTEELVSSDGQCAAPPATLAQSDESPPATTNSVPAADHAAGSVAGAPVPAGSANKAAAPTANSGLQRLEPGSGAPPPVAGGIALGMTECQAVQRAGTPNNVDISANQKGDRKVVLTYSSGPWPGIYTFVGGRLNVVERGPEQPKPATTKKAPKKKTPPKTANREFERTHVQ
jgi:hypothetical protein